MQQLICAGARRREVRHAEDGHRGTAGVKCCAVHRGRQRDPPARRAAGHGQAVGHVGLFARLLLYPGGGWESGGCRRLRAAGAALGLGSVLLVQALLVTALLFALPINARVTRRRMTRRNGRGRPCWPLRLQSW
ncbi:hypothetical protein I553_1709 [Mycobacterium xenopi 4042]|uniref:Uncharacterized protein n=1 Tax=Mycobacterium xenopi 4042 TaxID=1299334 RepID=X7ZBF6_MYCXE|nr:hypothetical protein I553_1709 [Mycobacterium xenopi 4042]